MSDILGHLNYWLATLLLLIGLHGMLIRPNLVKKLMAMNVMQVAVIMFFISLAVKTGGTAPIELHGDGHTTPQAAAYINPLPHALMLTAIVVGVSTTGVALALLIRIYRHYGTLEEPEILERMQE
ncbi:MAG: cation:proton antiporter subunit C [Candidatus Tectomicrobia bacterium]|nr:cation:proton antiporter subunit C [Candidatus Tectomicrobia bacterium]